MNRRTTGAMPEPGEVGGMNRLSATILCHDHLSAMPLGSGVDPLWRRSRRMTFTSPDASVPR
jgi:hypothetical protein